MKLEQDCTWAAVAAEVVQPCYTGVGWRPGKLLVGTLSFEGSNLHEVEAQYGDHKEVQEQPYAEDVGDVTLMVASVACDALNSPGGDIQGAFAYTLKGRRTEDAALGREAYLPSFRSSCSMVEFHKEGTLHPLVGAGSVNGVASSTYPCRSGELLEA